MKKILNKKLLSKIIPIILVILLAGGFLYWQSKKNRIIIDDSLINAPIINISPTAGGRLLEMDAVEGKTIRKGDTIAVVGSETIRSTTDGLVIMANNQIGGSLTPANTVAQLIDPAQMRVIGTIDENKGLNQLHIGQVVSFSIDAFPGKTYWGYIDEISPTAKQTQVTFSISSERPTQQFQVYARFNSSEHSEIKNGMSAKMTVFTNTP